MLKGTALKIYWKMKILLLAISLIPLIMVAVLYHATTTKLGNRLAADTQKTLALTAQGFLKSLVNDYGRILNRDKEILELILTMQAQEITRKLAGPPPELPNIIYSKSYTKGFKPPGGMVLSNKHYQFDQDKKRIPMQVTYKEQAYFLVKGTKLDAVKDDMARLSGMPGYYHMLYQAKPDLLLWQYTSFESGLHTGFPGSGGLPSDFDHRKRQWYKRAKDTGSMVWGPPVVDALTQSTALTLSRPVYRSDGSFAGVTAVDVLVSDVFKELKLPEQWSAQAKMTSVVPIKSEKNGEQKLAIVAQMDYVDLRQDWQIPVELEFLQSGETTQLAALIRDAMSGRSGVRKMPFNGKDSLWAYGARGPGNTFPIIIVPYDLIVTQAVTTKYDVIKTTLRGMQITAIILFGVILVVMFLAVFVTRRFTGPITQLSEAAKRLSNGDYQTKVNIKTGDELQELGNIFNSMGKELKLHQQQLVQADKMASLGILVSGMAHEINTPNSLILLNMPQLQRAWIDIEPILTRYFQQHGDFEIGGFPYSQMREDIPEILEDTQDRAKRIKRIVYDLKSFGRRDNSDSMEPVNLNEVAKAALRLVQNSVNKVTRHFTLQLEENIPHFMGNAQRIEQVVVNLMLNACQAIENPDQGILLRTWFYGKKNELILEVEDEGCGIAQEHLPKLMDPFFTTRRELGGTGLGLSISDSIVQEHSGRIEFDSVPGKGTHVKLILPRES